MCLKGCLYSFSLLPGRSVAWRPQPPHPPFVCDLTDPPIPPPARFLSSRCSSCNLKEVVSQKMKHLAAKPCPRCSLTLQSNTHTPTYTPPPPHTHTHNPDKNPVGQQQSKTMATMSKRHLTAAQTYNSELTRPRHRVMLLSNPPTVKRTAMCSTMTSAQMKWVWRSRWGWIVKALVFGEGTKEQSRPFPYRIIRRPRPAVI